MSNLEKEFQKNIITRIVGENGFEISQDSNYNTKYALDDSKLINFLSNSTKSNKERLIELQKKYPNTWKHVLCQSINEGLKRESIAQFFKTEYNGFKYFLNDQNHPEKNIVSVIPELTYEAERAEGNPRIDLVIFINGFPLITIELKKTDSGATFTYSGKEYQPNYKAAIAQYRYDRNQNNLLFSNRVMANFAMDEYEVYKNDKLEGELSKFLPFNKDYKKPNSDFFYKEFLTKENIINLIDNYYYQTKDKWNISPRYHQFAATENCIKDIKQNGLGRNYLFQEAAGSGKTKQQCWLANRLYWTGKFNKVFLLSDRSVLDDNLNDDLQEIETSLNYEGSVTNFVQAIKSDISDNSLACYVKLDSNTVIVSTIQKFPFIKEILKTCKDKTYAVIIDEAHSSTDGEYLRAVKTVKDWSETNKNLSIFAFTATPKDKTMELFGTKDNDGVYKPFFQYSHNQAVSEGMIIDVLAGNIKTYERKESLQDPRLEKIYNDASYATRVLREEVNNNLEILALECKHDITHFLTYVEKELDHNSKIMIISSSRKNAQMRAKILAQQLAEQGSDLKVLVGYSGELSAIEDDSEEKNLTSEEITTTFNKEGEVKLCRKLTGDDKITDVGDSFKKNNKYRILVCANKFQTGFDVPQLCGLYVHKIMSSTSNAFQTYNRLDRNYQFINSKGEIIKKENTYIIDWVNSIDYINNSFKEFSDEKSFGVSTNQDKLLAECKELITKLNIPDSSLEMLGEKYANEITSFNSYKKMRDNVVELDTYCNEVEALKEEERFTRKGNLMLFKEKYNWLLNLEIKDEYSNMNCFEYKYYCFVKIVLSCLKPNHYDRPDFSGMIKFLSKDVQERISKQKNDGDFPEQENSPSKKREIKLNELIEKYNKAYGCFEKRQDKETGNLIKTTLLKMENDEELIRRAKTNEYADWRIELTDKFESEIDDTDLYSLPEKKEFINEIVSIYGTSIYAKIKQESEGGKNE